MKNLLTLSVVFLTSIVHAPTGEASPQPNVLFLLTDDQRFDALGCMGHPHLKTPHIDRIANEGLLFRNHFCTTSLCSPSRASILSGLYAHSHGVANNFTEYPAGMVSFPMRLQELGYETAYLGKWHMGEKNDNPRPGFDYFVTHKGQGKYFDTEFNFNGQGRRIVPGYYTTVVTDLAQQWISERKGNRPWLLMIGHKAPHSFYVPEKKYEQTFDDVEIGYPKSAFHLHDKPAWFKKRLDTWHGIYGPLFEWRKEFPDKRPAAVADFARMVRAYWGTILSVDDGVGRLYDFLKQRGELDNTLIIFTSDNGPLKGDRTPFLDSAGGLRGTKATLYEGGLRVPMIARWPGAIPEGQVRSGPWMFVDVFPTLIEVAGGSVPDGLDGISVLPTLKGEPQDLSDRALYWEFSRDRLWQAVRKGPWKGIRFGSDQPLELYNLEHDRAESKNLASDYPEVVANLETIMDASHVPSPHWPVD